MAPSYGTGDSWPTTIGLEYAIACDSTDASFGHLSSFSGTFSANSSREFKTKVETKKERIKRIAAEKMYASWITYQEKTMTIRLTKQVCKPRHLLRYR